MEKEFKFFRKSEVFSGELEDFIFTTLNELSGYNGHKYGVNALTHIFDDG